MEKDNTPIVKSRIGSSREDQGFSGSSLGEQTIIAKPYLSIIASCSQKQPSVNSVKSISYMYDTSLIGLENRRHKSHAYQYFG